MKKLALRPSDETGGVGAWGVGGGGDREENPSPVVKHLQDKLREFEHWFNRSVAHKQACKQKTL